MFARTIQKVPTILVEFLTPCNRKSFFANQADHQSLGNNLVWTTTSSVDSTLDRRAKKSLISLQAVFTWTCGE